MEVVDAIVRIWERHVGYDQFWMLQLIMESFNVFAGALFTDANGQALEWARVIDELVDMTGVFKVDH